MPSGDLPAMRTHVAKEYGQYGEKAPWERTAGIAYETMLRLLREQPPEGEQELARMRTTIVSLAEEVFATRVVLPQLLAAAGT